MHRSISATALAALVVMAATSTAAQGQALGLPVSVDGRVEAAFPLGDFADIAGTGAGVGVGVAFTVAPGFGVYGGYSQTRFGGGWFGDEPSDATDSGFAVGLSASLPGALAVAPWVGGGLLFHQLEVRGSSSGVTQDMGFELGAGVAIPLADQLRLSPAVNYRRYNAAIPAIGGLVARDLTVQYLSLGVGLNLMF